MFHAKDLELLALDLLSGVQLDFWVARAARHLLSKVGCSNKHTEAKDLMKHYTVPTWLLEYSGQPPLLPWMPATLLSENGTAHQTCGSSEKSVLDKNEHCETDEVPTLGPPVHEGECYVDEEMREDREDEMIGLGTPPHLYERGKRILEEQLLSTASLNTLQDEGNILDISTNMTQKDSECNKLSSEGEGSSVYALAHSLREAWLERQPTLEDLHSFCNLPDTTTFFDLLKPWEMKDDTILNMIKVFLRKDSGFAWSAQILSYCLLPKMLHLEEPASRFLVSAVIEAAEVHPRAVVDALLIPLVLCEKGPSKAQCDVFNRILKECLPDNHILSFCGKMFLRNRRQQLPFGKPPFVLEDFLSKSLVWTEPAWAVLQNMLSRSILLDEELLEALVSGCGEEVARFAKSLKFSNLLLCLLSNFGPRLKPYKSMFQKITEQTETFMTKSLIAKSSAL